MRDCPWCLMKDCLKPDLNEEIWQGEQYIKTVSYYICRHCDRVFNNESNNNNLKINYKISCNEYQEFRDVLKIKTNNFETKLWNDIKRRIKFELKDLSDSGYWGEKLKKLREL